MPVTAGLTPFTMFSVLPSCRPSGGLYLFRPRHTLKLSLFKLSAFSTPSRHFSIHHSPHDQPLRTSKPRPTFRENIYTLPNVLTVSRILACPVLGWSILESNFYLATSLLLYAGLTDLVCFRYVPDWQLFVLKCRLARLMGFWPADIICERLLEQYWIQPQTKR
jgi:hypothetical protein